MILLFNAIIIGLIIFVIVWFWLTHGTITTLSKNKATILVDKGVYSPNLIEASNAQPIDLTFIRKDETPCSEIVIFEALNIQATLPLNQPYVVTIKHPKPGKYTFTCQMGMYHGELIVKP